MPVPYHVAATALKTIIDAEFTDRSAAATHDKLHESLGYRRLEIGLSPIRRVLQPGNEIVAQQFILVQWYDLWDKEIDNEQTVNPFNIAEMAYRFETALESQSATASNQVWFFKVPTIEFPDDPTGNKTRFEATVVAYGDAPLAETMR